MLIFFGMAANEIKGGEMIEIIVNPPDDHGEDKKKDAAGKPQEHRKGKTKKKDRKHETTVMSVGDGFAQKKVKNSTGDRGNGNNQTQLGIGKTTLANGNGNNISDKAVKKGEKEEHEGGSVKNRIGGMGESAEA